MQNKWFDFVVAGVAILTLAVLVVSDLDIKIPGSKGTASVIDAVTDTIPTEPALTDTAPIESTPTEPAPTEPAPTDTASTITSVFIEVLQTVTDSVKNFIEPPALVNPAPITKGISGFRVFILAQDVLELTVNEWFSAQRNIVVDQLNVQDYGGGGYLVVISYHTGDTGNSSARLKLIAGENSEADAQNFLLSLGASQTVRSVAAVAGSYSMPEKTITVPIIFIVYE